MNILKSGGTLFLAYEVRMGRANVQSSTAKLAALFLIGHILLYNDTRNKRLGCFEKFRKFSI